MTVNFEKYLRGDPLNEELAKLRAGQMEDPIPYFQPFPQLSEQLAADHPLNDDDRQLLREARANGTLATLMQLEKRFLQQLIRSATIVSEADPLANADEISRTWAYVMMFRRAILEMENIVNMATGEGAKQ
jgi:hypothetical protein